jgi:hypothetical protein
MRSHRTVQRDDSCLTAAVGCPNHSRCRVQSAANECVFTDESGRAGCHLRGWHAAHGRRAGHGQHCQHGNVLCKAQHYGHAWMHTGQARRLPRHVQVIACPRAGCWQVCTSPHLRAATRSLRGTYALGTASQSATTAPAGTTRRAPQQQQQTLPRVPRRRRRCPGGTATASICPAVA